MYSDAKIGGVGIWLDEIVPCLKDTETGEIKETVVFRIESRSFLKKFNEKNGWGIDWIEVPNSVEVFALALKENNEIQGLVGVKNDISVKAAYLHWGCTAPHNNKYRFGVQKYSGVGGHLFAIAADRSILWGHEGFVHRRCLPRRRLRRGRARARPRIAPGRAREAAHRHVPVPRASHLHGAREASRLLQRA